MSVPPRRINTGTFFVTTITNERRRAFQVEANCRLFLEKLEAYRNSYLLHAYVLMPEHVHLLITPTTVPLERAMQLIKGGFSHALHSGFPVWQRGFTDRRVRDADEAQRMIEYIHQNPVKKALAATPEDFAFSSAGKDGIRLDDLPAYLRG